MTDKILDDSDICTDGATTGTRDSIVDVLRFDTTQQKVLQVLHDPLISTDQSSMEITVPKAEYERLKQELRTKDRKLVAFNNIHLLIQEKDVEISSLKEKIKSQADALMFSEMRYSQLVRLTAKSAKHAERLNPERERCDVKTQIDGDETRVISRNIKLVRNFEGNSNLGKTCDDEVLEKKQAVISVEGPFKQTKPETLDTKSSGRGSTPSGEAGLEPHRGDSISDPKTSKLTARKIGSEDETAAFERESSEKNSSVGVRLYRPPGKGFLKDPGVSKDLVSKLIQQNARLKQVLRQVAGHHGFTIEEYLVKFICPLKSIHYKHSVHI